MLTGGASSVDSHHEGWTQVISLAHRHGLLGAIVCEPTLDQPAWMRLSNGKIRQKVCGGLWKRHSATLALHRAQHRVDICYHSCVADLFCQLYCFTDGGIRRQVIHEAKLVSTQP